MSKLPYKEIEPAGADRKEWDKLEPLFEDDAWYAEDKLDGWRFLMHFGRELPRMFLTGRNKTKVSGTYSERGLHVPDLAPPAQWMKAFAYTVLDGEIMPPDGAGFRDINGIMGKTSVEKAHARIMDIGHPDYFAFDLLFLDGVDVRDQPQSWRKAKCDELVASMDMPYIWSVQMFTEQKLKFYEHRVSEGGEGIILKNQDAPYGSGWVKVKRFHYLDVVVTGFTDAKEGKTGKYKGLIGAVKVSVFNKDRKLVEVGQVSGMTDEERVYFSNNRQKFTDTKPVIEIKAQEFSKDRLRHPRFSRWRHDLNKTACTWDKMHADLKANRKQEN